MRTPRHEIPRRWLTRQWSVDGRHRPASFCLGTSVVLTLLVGCSPPDRATTDRDGPGVSAETPTPFRFTAVQPELFSDPGAQPNAWADYDNDGDLDLFVGFRGAPDRLYRNDGGTFVDVAPELGLADPLETRAAAWGDFNGDGHLDLFVGYPAREEKPNRLYRNEGDGAAFTDVAAEWGLDAQATTRQPAFIDYDQDGDLDLFVAFRDAPNRLWRNDGSRFTDVTEEAGIGDPRRTVGVAWFDMDMDGDLDHHVSNQNGDADAFFRNNGDGTFTDVAPDLGMDWPDRGEEYGSVGPAVTDYDNDGDLDLFIATYGPDVLWQNQGDGTFVNVAPGTVLSPDHHSTTAAWGDADNDGWPDLFVAAYLSTVAEVPDNLFRNVAGEGFDPRSGTAAAAASGTPAPFEDATLPGFLEKGASHGVSWADFDADGDLDLALANNNAVGTHTLYRNDLPPEAGESFQVAVVDAEGRWLYAGAEVRLYDVASGRLLGTRLVDTGGGYCSQSARPVHFGLGPDPGPVRVEVTVFRGGRRITTVRGGFDPATLAGDRLMIIPDTD